MDRTRTPATTTWYVDGTGKILWTVCAHANQAVPSLLLYEWQGIWKTMCQNLPTNEWGHLSMIAPHLSALYSLSQTPGKTVYKIESGICGRIRLNIHVGQFFFRDVGAGGGVKKHPIGLKIYTRTAHRLGGNALKKILNETFARGDVKVEVIEGNAKC